MTSDPKEISREIDIMKLLKHPNIVSLVGVCTRESPFYIVTEFMAKGNLLDVLHQLDGKQSDEEDFEFAILVYIAQQVGLAMVYLASLRIIHRLVPIL